MRFARKLAYALWIGICLVFGVNGIDRFRREAQLFESDIRRDHEVMGRGLVGAVAELWEDEGMDRALDIVERANARESQVQIRWVDVDTRAFGREPAAPAEVLAPVEAGATVSWIDPERDETYTYVPLRVGDAWRGAIELSESLEPEHAYLRASLVRLLATFGSLAILSGAIAMALGALFVGRPIRLLVEKARRVGAGDFTGALDLRQDDELGELAREMNAMADGLAAAKLRVDAETRARAQTTEQLRHAERLTTVGKLASGVAHELGTPLNVIGLRAGMIAEGEVTGEAARAGARVIQEQADRISRIVRQLLDFARRGTLDRADHDVVGIVERSVAMMEPLARRAGVEVQVSADCRPIQASVDPVQIQQVLANLLLNGIQAMPDGGRISVDVRRAEAPPPPDVGAEATRCVVIRIDDAGVGMAPEVLEHVFDPFFTTKPVGEGTGLGLSVVYGIVREHGGWLSAVSSPGHGSSFLVHLPEAA